jgi:hypothetical protein
MTFLNREHTPILGDHHSWHNAHRWFFDSNFIRIPVAFALGLATIPVVLLELRLTPFIVDRMFQSCSFILLAVPFFLLAAKPYELWQSH